MEQAEHGHRELCDACTQVQLDLLLYLGLLLAESHLHFPSILSVMFHSLLVHPCRVEHCCAAVKHVLKKHRGKTAQVGCRGTMCMDNQDVKLDTINLSI